MTDFRRTVCCGAVLCLVLCGFRVSGGAQSLPVYFVENRELLPGDVSFFVRGRDRVVYFERRGLTLALKPAGTRRWAVKVDFLGAQPTRAEGMDAQEAFISYFGRTTDGSAMRLRTFGGIRYRGVWPGIDLTYRGDGNRLKYELTVAPGADPARIAFRYRAATSVSVTREGALRVTTPVGVHEDDKPIAWQVKDGERHPVAVRFEVTVERDTATAARSYVVRFAVGDCDPRFPLVIDPAFFVHSGYIGGADRDEGRAVTVDPSGCAIIVGHTESDETTFPVRGGPILSSVWGGFITKLNPTGTGIIYSGFIPRTTPNDVTLDAAGNAYVTGNGISQMPVVGTLDPTYNGTGDAFITKVAADGSRLIYSGYLGGRDYETGLGIRVDSKNRAVIVGFTQTPENTFPVKGGPDPTINGFQDGFVARITADGSGIEFCGYIGGASGDSANAVAIDASDRIYIGGSTGGGVGFPVVRGPSLVPKGNTDGFVCKLLADGSDFEYSGFVGSSTYDAVNGVEVDAAGRLYVAGEAGADFPVRVGPFLQHGGPGGYARDAFVGRLNAAGTGFDYLGFIGGADYDRGLDVAIDPRGCAYVVGETESPETSLPVRRGPRLTKVAPGASPVDLFVARIPADGIGVDYLGYVGGQHMEGGGSIAVDRDGNAVITGFTWSDEQSFPLVVGPDLTFNSPGLNDAFVSRIALTATDGPATAPIGTRVPLRFTATNDVGLAYRAASSFGTGPITIDTRQVNLSFDPLLIVSLWQLVPTVFNGYSGLVPAGGEAAATIDVPSIPALVGLDVHTAFVTLSGTAPSGVRSIADTHTIRITARD